MATAIRTIGHEDRLSLVEHLTELRARLIISLATLTVAFGVCFWQNHALLHFINRPLQHQTQKSIRAGHGPLGQTAITQQAVLAQNAVLERELAVIAEQGSGLHGGARAQLAALQGQFQAAVKRVPRTPVGDQPTTLGIGEPFTQTLTISFYFALLFALPVILWQLYGFLLPAFTPGERRIAMPLMVSVPALFIAGVAFGYLVVLPAAVRFFQNFNSGEFNILVQASPYYHFAAIVLLLMGLVFQVPVAIVGATRAGLVSVAQLRKGRRFAIVVAAVVAALLPADLITMILEMLPLVVLYELSILIAALFERRDRRNAVVAATAAAAPQSTSAESPSDDAV